MKSIISSESLSPREICAIFGADYENVKVFLTDKNKDKDPNYRPNMRLLLFRFMANLDKDIIDFFMDNKNFSNETLIADRDSIVALREKFGNIEK